MDEHPDSALHILQKLPPEKYNSDANRALYGIILFQALDKNYMPLQPDSIIDFSIDYYLKQEDKPHLAIGYFYKGRKLKNEMKYEKASIELYKSIDYCGKDSNYLLLGKIYSDLATINFTQKENNEARRKYHIAASFFSKAGEKRNISNEYLNIGYTYVVEKKYKIARVYYTRVYSLDPDSLTIGAVLYEIGTSYYHNKQFDSASYYYKKSLSYPVRKINKSVRCYTVADVMFNTKQYDSSTVYAIKSLEYPANYYTRRECYRILVNVSYLKGDMKLMKKYMSKYQEYTDSIRSIESQTKATVIEHQHNSKVESASVKQNLTIVRILLVTTILIIIITCVYLYHRSNLRKLEIKNYEQELNSKQAFVSRSIINKIEELKSIQTKIRKNAQPSERIKLIKELYNNALHIDNWEIFSSEMNHTFNNIVTKLQTEYSTLSRKEISLCCLQLLDIPNADKALLLESTTEGLYKLKQRVAQKINLTSTKELDTHLRNIVEIRN